MANVFYVGRVREICASSGNADLDPSVVLAWMLTEHGTLDRLSPEQFELSVIAAAGHAKVSSASGNAALAASFGLKTWAEADLFDGARKGN